MVGHIETILDCSDAESPPAQCNLGDMKFRIRQFVFAAELKSTRLHKRWSTDSSQTPSTTQVSSFVSRVDKSRGPSRKLHTFSSVSILCSIVSPDTLISPILYEDRAVLPRRIRSSSISTRRFSSLLCATFCSTLRVYS
jgi:hypothetical protein